MENVLSRSRLARRDSENGKHLCKFSHAARNGEGTVSASLARVQTAIDRERRGYLVPLCDGDQVPRSYLFAVGRRHTKETGSVDLTEELAVLLVTARGVSLSLAECR